MSKITLKKEMKQLSAEQLAQIILNLYDARKEAREYLDFFVHPNVEKKLEKQLSIVEKEMRRTKWGRSRGRVTIIKKAINDFISLQPGDEYCIDMLFGTLQRIGTAERYAELSDTLERLVADLVGRIFTTADAIGRADSTIRRMEELTAGEQYSRRFRQLVREAAQKVDLQFPGLKK